MMVISAANWDCCRRSLSVASLGVTQTTRQFIYREVGVSQIDGVRPLWEELNTHHALLLQRFGDELRQRTFESRKQELLAKAKGAQLKIDLVNMASGGAPLAYCISSISAGNVAEIDSIFVKESSRGSGIGTELMNRALAWLDASGATSRIISIAYGNDDAQAFYARFGFYPRSVLLQQDKRPGN